MNDNIEPVLSNSYFIYKDVRYEVEFYELLEEEKLPDLPWSQLYLVGNINGKVPLVMYKSSKDNLPGGGIEQGETVEEALHREVLEELNMKVIDWIPLGYQKNISENGDVYFQLRVYANLENIDDFERDPGGSVIGHKLVNIDEINNYIQWGEVGDWLVCRTKQLYTHTKN